MKQYKASKSCIEGKILDNIATSIVVVDDAFLIQELNAAAEILFSTSIKKVQRTCFFDLVNLSGIVIEQIQKSLELDRPYTSRETILSVVGKQTHTVDISVTPLVADSQNRYLIIELTEVDRHIRIAREEALLRQQTTTSNIIRGLAHEIKNPLGGLRGAAQLLERELPSDELKEYTRILIGEADRLQSLINRMTGPVSRPNLAMVNIHEILQYVRQLLMAEDSGHVEFKTDYDPSIPLIYVDRDWMVQAILNIAGNALQAVNGEGTISFVTRIMRNFTIGSEIYRLVLRIQVIDDGPGISQEMLGTVFYPMITGKEGGTGLGLSIAQTLISQQKGLIECTSEPGRTVFTVLIPIRNGDDE
ncbi:MAG TPA: PAS domain-containing sensor histidine kinase [Gammaproteobacteria bacterium]|nr:PAS domain-containing sensor histidine kinase [Gammaproteobacteria bacterium]